MSTKLATVVADFTTQLSTVLAVGGTSATLKSATDDDGNALPSGIYFFTVDGNNSQKEHFVCSLSGTSLTSLQSVSRQGVETSGAVRSHRVGATVTITDWGHLKFIIDLLKGATPFDVNHPLAYDATGAAMTNPFALATVEYVLSVVNGGAVSINQLTIAGTAGESFAAGAPIYLKPSDSKWYKLLANDSQLASVQNIQIGIALGSGTANTLISGGVQIAGLVSNLSGLTANNVYYISDTGTLSTSAGTYTVPVGIAISTSALVLAPRNANIPTPAQNAAMGTISVAPSGANKFLTQNELGVQTPITIPLGEAFTGATTPQPAVIINDLFQSRIDGMYAIGQTNASDTRTSKRATSITTQSAVTSSSLQMVLAKVGAPSDNMKITIETDSAGSPSGTPIANGTSNTIAASTLSTTVPAITTFSFASPFTLVAGTKYWIVVQRDSTLDDSNYYLAGGLLDDGGGTQDYASFAGKLNNGAWINTNGFAVSLVYFDILPASGSGSLSLWQSQATAGPDYMKNAMGICITTGAAGANGSIYLSGVVGGFSGLIPESNYYISSSKGVITTTDAGQFIGTAISATQIVIPASKIGSAFSYGSATATTIKAFAYNMPIKAHFNGNLMVTVTPTVTLGTKFLGVTVTVSDNAAQNVNVKTYYAQAGATATATVNNTLTVPIRKGQFVSVVHDSGANTNVFSLSFIPQF